MVVESGETEGSGEQEEREVQETPNERTNDSMFRGRVGLQQHRKGYRFSVDAVLLGHFAARMAPVATLDVGTGCGVVALLLADLWAQEHEQSPAITAIEIQPSLAALARENVAQNGRATQIEIVEGDMREWAQTAASKWSLITLNPPYFPAQSGKHSQHMERAQARHECNGTLGELFSACTSVLAPRGTLLVVFPAEELPRLLRTARSAGLHLWCLQPIHPQAHALASLVLVGLRLRASVFSLPAPVFLYEDPSHRVYTPFVESLFNGNAWPPWEF